MHVVALGFTAVGSLWPNGLSIINLASYPVDNWHKDKMFLRKWNLSIRPVRHVLSLISCVSQWRMRLRAPLSGAEAGGHRRVSWGGSVWLCREARYVDLSLLNVWFMLGSASDLFKFRTLPQDGCCASPSFSLSQAALKLRSTGSWSFPKWRPVVFHMKMT